MDAQVIVVGAGPAGMMLAGELRLAGVDVVVLEKLAARTGESRGLGFTARTMEVFDQRGLLPRFGDIEVSNVGHFGGLPVDFGVLDGAHQAAKTIPQSATETVLEEWATQLGADIRRSHEVMSVKEKEDSVEVEVRGPDGEHRLRAEYLVGCDGGRSTIRKAVGFDFPGTAATLEMFLADVRGIQLEPRMIGETLPGGMVMVGPLPGGVTRLIVCERGTPPQRREKPPTWEEVAAAWQRLTGDDISHAEPVWVSSFGDATRQVTEYRRGRIFLAGDSAHIHLPAGGQGMNTSIQDAVNLGWKLGAVVRGRAPETLLDTYHGERHPVGRRLLMNTQAQGLLFLSGPEVQPLRDVLTELIRYPEVSRHFAAMVSGLEIHYDVDGGTHPLLGRRLPDVGLTGHKLVSSSTEALRAGRGVLLDLTGNERLRDRAYPWWDRVDVVSATPVLPEGSVLEGTTAVLVRPDGYVAWAAPGSHADLPMALERWFGPAR
ncbi:MULTISPECIES: FAD-dependent monooxygenase [unclassified Streptomyces]|uniref:FAD-dependent monooxygenase n=1 Tax=unclassified Streptomyces TaxID=2593676 RepID=UPI001F0482C8|nr:MULTISPECIES: FAD-dependent monooxygenase [unclassified Streptomyces]MCH0564257.1 FAD-dependent monooxygenase [Streptomyces sp. MUM 2J]MCH0569428.1 FAD-dependent monooxygenase [Streptomyces sp. MUM 136J]